MFGQGTNMVASSRDSGNTQIVLSPFSFRSNVVPVSRLISYPTQILMQFIKRFVFSETETGCSRWSSSLYMICWHFCKIAIFVGNVWDGDRRPATTRAIFSLLHSPRDATICPKLFYFPEETVKESFAGDHVENWIQLFVGDEFPRPRPNIVFTNIVLTDIHCRFV